VPYGGSVLLTLVQGEQPDENDEGSADNEPSEPPSKKRKAIGMMITSSGKTGRKKRKRDKTSADVVDETPIDEADTTMASICADTGRGRLSSKGLAALEARKAAREERKRLSKAMKLDAKKVKRQMKGLPVSSDENSEAEAEAGREPIASTSRLDSTPAPSVKEKSPSQPVGAGKAKSQSVEREASAGAAKGKAASGRKTVVFAEDIMEPDSDEDEPISRLRVISEEPAEREEAPVVEAVAQDEDGPEFVESQLVPQARIRDGRLVLDEDSMQITRAASVRCSY
jgi:hypothetical protein